MIRGVFTLLIATMLACDPGPAGFAPCDVRQTRCQHDLFAWAEDLRQQLPEPGQKPPRISVVSREAHITRLLRYLPDFQARALDATWSGPLQRLGLLAPGIEPSGADRSWNEGSVANYWPDRRDITLVEAPALSFTTGETNAMVVHELLHAAQDREFALGYFGRTTTDAQMVVTAFIEGEATLYGEIARLTMAGESPDRHDWHARYSAEIAARRAFLAKHDAAYSEVRLSFPYALGASFLGQAWRHGGPTAVNLAFYSPPRATVQLMLAMEGAPTELPPPVTFCPPRLDRARFIPAEVDALGAGLLYASLLRLLDDQAAWSAALTWQDDRIWLYQGASGAMVSLWRVKAPGLRATPGGALLAARTTPPLLVGDDLLDWSSDEPGLADALRASLDCR